MLQYNSNPWVLFQPSQKEQVYGQTPSQAVGKWLLFLVPVVGLAFIVISKKLLSTLMTVMKSRSSLKWESESPPPCSPLRLRNSSEKKSPLSSWLRQTSVFNY